MPEKPDGVPESQVAESGGDVVFCERAVGEGDGLKGKDSRGEERGERSRGGAGSTPDQQHGDERGEPEEECESLIERVLEVNGPSGGDPSGDDFEKGSEHRIGLVHGYAGSGGLIDEQSE